MHPYSKAAMKVLSGELNVEERPWFCLKVVRQIIEHAEEWPSHEFYKRYWIEKVEQNDTATPWARDLERSLRNLGYAVSNRGPKEGDIIFNYRAAWPYGHVALMLTDELVIENTPSDRGFKGPGALRICHISEWGEPTTVVRL